MSLVICIPPIGIESEKIILSAIKLKLFSAKSIFEEEKINKKEKTINL